MSSCGGQAVDIRHWILGWATTTGASTRAVVATAATTPPAAAMNRRRSDVTAPPEGGWCDARGARGPGGSCLEKLMVRALRDVVPGAELCLQLSERGVDLPGHGALVGLVPDHLGGHLLEVTQDRDRELDNLHLALELGP